MSTHTSREKSTAFESEKSSSLYFELILTVISLDYEEIEYNETIMSNTVWSVIEGTHVHCTVYTLQSKMKVKCMLNVFFFNLERPDHS